MEELSTLGMPFIDALEKRLKAEEATVINTKTAINFMLQQIGQPARYSELATASASAGPLRGDELYGKSMSSAARDVLDRRHHHNLGPATVGEIHAGLKEGGYQFEAKNEDIEKQSLRNLLVKNTSIFHRLPNGKYGLLSWYPGVKEKKPTATSIFEKASSNQGVPAPTTPGALEDLDDLEAPPSDGADVPPPEL